MLKNTDKANRIFWNEICGTVWAKELGIGNLTKESLHKFDSAFFYFYPYLLDCVKIDRMEGKKVLEVGLGYGSLGQKIAERAAYYVGLDIAENPVQLMSYRLKRSLLAGEAVVGSVLNSPFPSEIFDIVVSVGCFHHTGDVQGCIDETFRVLKPGGVAFIMVYNQYSYRQWLRWPIRTLSVFLHEKGLLKRRSGVSEELRASYDIDSKGEAAPETVFLTICQLRTLFTKYREVSFRKENFRSARIERLFLLNKSNMLLRLGKIWGADIYITARK